MSDKAEREKRFKKLVRQQKLGTLFANAFAKRKRNLFDKLLIRVAARLAPKAKPEDDFMRDPLIDAAPEFTVEELKRFQSGNHR